MHSRKHVHAHVLFDSFTENLEYLFGFKCIMFKIKKILLTIKFNSYKISHTCFRKLSGFPVNSYSSQFVLKSIRTHFGQFVLKILVNSYSFGQFVLMSGQFVLILVNSYSNSFQLVFDIPKPC